VEIDLHLDPGVALTISPTVNPYGSEFGTDKIAHLFQQGYTYYKSYRRALAEGATPAEATTKAIRWGQKIRAHLLRDSGSGRVFKWGSVCELRGLEVLQGLTKPITIGDTTRAAVLELHEGRWSFKHNAPYLLKPLISETSE